MSRIRPSGQRLPWWSEVQLSVVIQVHVLCVCGRRVSFDVEGVKIEPDGTVRSVLVCPCERRYENVQLEGWADTKPQRAADLPAWLRVSPSGDVVDPDDRFLCSKLRCILAAKACVLRQVGRRRVPESNREVPLDPYCASGDCRQGTEVRERIPDYRPPRTRFSPVPRAKLEDWLDDDDKENR